MVMKETPRFSLKQLIWATVVMAVVMAMTASALRGGEFGVAVGAGAVFALLVLVIPMALACLALLFAPRRP